jgi:hypothetical protein
VLPCGPRIEILTLPLSRCAGAHPAEAPSAQRQAGFAGSPARNRTRAERWRGNKIVVASTRDSACSAPTAAQLIALARCRATTQQPTRRLGMRAFSDPPSPARTRPAACDLVNTKPPVAPHMRALLGSCGSGTAGRGFCSRGAPLSCVAPRGTAQACARTAYPAGG